MCRALLGATQPPHCQPSKCIDLGKADPLRIVFAGTPEAAVPSLRAVLTSRHTVAAVITRPDARREAEKNAG